LDPSAVWNVIKRVCNNPEIFDREDPSSGKRYACFSLFKIFYFVVVFTKDSVVRIITIFMTTSERVVTKKCGRYHPLIAE
jgi:hypothetical protein